MLQWMGGSRRKVNASRGSKQKRQKQYFEQRKRQQCQNITSFVDNFVDGYNPCRLNPKEKRSLDVLSLHSLSQISEGCSFASADGILEVDPFPDKSTKIRTLPKLIDKIVTSVNNAETLQITGSGNISNSPKLGMLEQKIGTSNLCNSTLDENPDGDELKHASNHQFEDMSVFELIDEDGKSMNKSEEDTEYEAHVAFSMQGLGKVGTETPVNSPQPFRRIMSDDQSGLFKAARRFPLYSCRNFENLLEDHEMDVESMMGNDDVFSNEKYLSSDWGQSGRFGSYGHEEPDFLKYSSTGLYDNNPRVKYFDDKENFGVIHKFHADFLEDCPSLPDGSSFNEKLDICCENTCFTDIYNTSSHEADFTEDFSFAKRDQYGRTGRFWDLDFSSQHPKHQLAEDCDFLKSDHSNARYFTANKFINAGAKQSRYSYLKADDPMDNFSSLSSGESCSSSAVKGGGFAGVPTARKTLERNNIYNGIPSKYQSIKEEFNGQLAASTKCIPGQHGEYERPREYRRRSCDSFPSNPVHTVLSEFTFGETFGQVDDLSCKDGFPSTSIHLAQHTDFGSTYHSSDKDHLSGLSKPVGEDIYGLLSASNFHFDSHMSFGGCIDDSSVESKCPMDTSFKRSAFGQDFSSSKYFSSFRESGCRTNGEGSHQEIDTCVQSSDSTEGSAKQGDKYLSTNQRSAHRNAHENNIKGKASHEKEICAGPEGILSGTLKPLCETHDKLSKKNTDDILDRIIQENDNETSSLIGLSDYSGSRASEKKCRNNTFDLQPQQLDPGNAPLDLPCDSQRGRLVSNTSGLYIGTSESEQRSVAREGEISSIEPSCQLMMLESHAPGFVCKEEQKICSG